ncbi:MAG TPA: GntR family transcriptional regulator [Actinomycetota bacterium]|nr:GntR family transcriptional regulator [Actinomycetota bacterium]
MTASALIDAPPAVLDREAPLPLWAQLKDALLREIREGGLEPGDRFPSEAAIRDRYRVSRATVRQALAELEAGGVIRKVQGLGSFLAVPKIRHVPLLTSFTDLASSQGFVPSHRVLSSSVEEVPADAAAEVGLAEGTRCRLLRRLFLADGSPVGLAETWLPVSVLRGHDELLEGDRLDEGSMYGVLRSPPIGLVLDHAVETISPGVADASSAELLGCEAGTPVLLIRRLTFTPDGQSVESTRLVFVGDRYEYRVELQRPEPGEGR